MTEAHADDQVRDHSRRPPVATAERVDPIETPQCVRRALDLVASGSALTVHPLNQLRDQVLYISGVSDLVLAVADLRLVPRVSIRAAAWVDSVNREALQLANVRLANVAHAVVAHDQRRDVVDLLDGVVGFKTRLVLGLA